MAKRWLRAAGLAGAALAVGIGTSGGRGRQLDENAFRTLNRERGEAADRFFSSITELGSWWAAGGAAAAIAATGRRRAAGRALAAASVTWLAGQGLKRLFLRPRPYEADPEATRLLIGRPSATSWPSSHPAVLLTFVTVAARELRANGGSRAALSWLAAAVGCSRVYLGVHYPADVGGGLLLGRAVAEAWSDANSGPR